MRPAAERSAALADRLIAAYARAELLPPLSATEPDFDVAAAYRVLEAISARRGAAGWRPAGRKIGFTNRSLWARYGVVQPIWAPTWVNTVHFATDDRARLGLAPFVQPRIEPEVVFKLKAAVPATEDARAVLAAVEWLAPGFEVVQCHYPGWKFTPPDCIAAFGLHGALIVGTPVTVAGADIDRWAARLATFEADLLRGGERVDRGGGALVLDSPALALAHLARALAAAAGPPLAAGEIITTGTLTDAWPVAAGETWSADYTTLGTRPLGVTFA
jgi:2-oxo-3-hexenedioate decarboxylase